MILCNFFAYKALFNAHSRQQLRKSSASGLVLSESLPGVSVVYRAKPMLSFHFRHCFAITTIPKENRCWPGGQEKPTENTEAVNKQLSSPRLVRGSQSPSPWGVGGGPKLWAGREEISHLELQCPSCARMTTLVGPHRNKDHWISGEKKKTNTKIFKASLNLNSQKYMVVIVQSLSYVRLSETPWTAAHQASLSITNSGSLLKLMSIELMMPSNPLVLCHPLLLLPSIFPSIRVFSNHSALRIRWPKYWSFSFSISPSNKYSGLISKVHC